jgi:DNA-binding NarL/FixJ family response regulator
MPTMMHDIILQLLMTESDFQVTAPTDKSSTLLDASKKYRPDIVVTSFGEDEANTTYRDLLLECPRLKALDVRSDGRKGYLYELRPERKRLGELSPESLVTAIREAALPAPLEKRM